MATLPTKSQSAIVSLIASGMQGRVSAFLNFTAGSVLRAFAEAYSGAALWLQGLALANAKLTRMASSYGSDADSFAADFFAPTDFQRLGAQASTGLATFSRFTAAPTAPFIQNGAVIQTADGTRQFAVYGDATNPAYSGAVGGYTMAAQVTTLVVPVRAVTPGSAGNVAAGTISRIVSSIPGVDSVVNVAALTNGIDQESDDALKARFRLTIASLSKGTETAIRAAVAALEANLQMTIREGRDLNGATDLGMVTVVVDDGSGNPSDALVQQCAAAINAVRAAGIRVGVFGAVTSLANVSMSITTGVGYDHDTVVAQVVAAVAAQINATGLGNDLDYFDLVLAARGVPGCTNVGSYLLNGQVGDLIADARTTFKSGTLTIS